jgi:hypothetical protein
MFKFWGILLMLLVCAQAQTQTLSELLKNPDRIFQPKQEQKKVEGTENQKKSSPTSLAELLKNPDQIRQPGTSVAKTVNLEPQIEQSAPAWPSFLDPASENLVNWPKISSDQGKSLDAFFSGNIDYNSGKIDCQEGKFDFSAAKTMGIYKHIDEKNVVVCVVENSKIQFFQFEKIVEVNPGTLHFKKTPLSPPASYEKTKDRETITKFLDPDLKKSQLTCLVNPETAWELRGSDLVEKSLNWGKISFQMEYLWIIDHREPVDSEGKKLGESYTIVFPSTERPCRFHWMVFYRQESARQLVVLASFDLR